MAHAFPVVLAGWMMLLGVACGPEDGPPPGDPASPETAADFLAAGRGKVVVLLLGMEGCEKTGEATETLARLAPGLPGDVAVARLDVPSPDGTVSAAENWPHPYFHAVDAGREIADDLGFFYYPTLYVLDRGGEVRFSGGCEAGRLGEMIAAIRAEKPGEAKHVFTPPLPAVGAPAPTIAAHDLGGDVVASADLRGDGPVLLLFTSMDCPFSSKAVATLAEFEDEDVTLVAIEKGGAAGAVATFYAELDLPARVIHDADGSICAKFGVEPVPFFFLVDPAGNISARGPYTPAAVRSALGLGGPAEPASGAG